MRVLAEVDRHDRNNAPNNAISVPNNVIPLAGVAVVRVRPSRDRRRGRIRLRAMPVLPARRLAIQVRETDWIGDRVRVAVPVNRVRVVVRVSRAGAKSPMSPHRNRHRSAV